MPLQGDRMDSLLLIIIAAVINFIFIKRTIFIISPPCKTLAMLEWLFFLLPLQVVPLDVINGTRKRSPLGYSMVRCLPLLRQHLALLRSLSAALLLSVWFLLVWTPTWKPKTRAGPTTRKHNWGHSWNNRVLKGIKKYQCLLALWMGNNVLFCLYVVHQRFEQILVNGSVNKS